MEDHKPSVDRDPFFPGAKSVGSEGSPDAFFPSVKSVGFEGSHNPIVPDKSLIHDAIGKADAANWLCQITSKVIDRYAELKEEAAGGSCGSDRKTEGHSGGPESMMLLEKRTQQTGFAR